MHADLFRQINHHPWPAPVSNYSTGDGTGIRKARIPAPVFTPKIDYSETDFGIFVLEPRKPKIDSLA